MIKVITLNNKDLDESILKNNFSVAIDTETAGLNLHRDRLCVIQIALSDDTCFLITLDKNKRPSYPIIKKILSSNKILKIFHYGRFDIAVLQHYFKIKIRNVFCTKIASKLVRTYSDRHGLATLCRELLGKELSKVQQSSDWGSNELTEAQKHYAASDVVYLHSIYEVLLHRLIREGRKNLAEECFKFLPARCDLDLLGWSEDIFDWKNPPK